MLHVILHPASRGTRLAIASLFSDVILSMYFPLIGLNNQSNRVHLGKKKPPSVTWVSIFDPLKNGWIHISGGMI